jgi:hypothetical protein
VSPLLAVGFLDEWQEDDAVVGFLTTTRRETVGRPLRLRRVADDYASDEALTITPQTRR